MEGTRGFNAKDSVRKEDPVLDASQECSEDVLSGTRDFPLTCPNEAWRGVIESSHRRPRPVLPFSALRTLP